jgi:monofunctional biosynthetic peptidoglycan transglycosylase
LSDLDVQGEARPIRLSPTASFWGRVWQWVKRNKVKSFLLVIALAAGIELLTIPWFDVIALSKTNPTETALMRQRISEARTEGKTIRVSQNWIPLSRIPRHVIDAIVVAEDGTFFSHRGFDWFEVRESIRKNVEKGRAARGASTITQQVAKNLYLSTSKDPVRKAKEALITAVLESTLNKERILEIYINIIEWGRGVFGIEAASRMYFAKSANALTLDEATRLAAVIPSPLKHRPDANSPYVLRRKQIVLNRMVARNLAAHTGRQEEESGELLDDATTTDDEPTVSTEEPPDSLEVREE